SSAMFLRLVSSSVGAAKVAWGGSALFGAKGVAASHPEVARSRCSTRFDGSFSISSGPAGADVPSVDLDAVRPSRAAEIHSAPSDEPQSAGNHQSQAKPGQRVDQ